MSRALPSQTIGPFFHFGLTRNPALGCLVRPETRGERIRICIRLLDGDGAPVPDGMIEIWQADADGRYDQDPAFHGFGRLATDSDGVCVFETVYPGRTPDGRGGRQAAHINVSIFARGLLDRLCTRVYFEGDAALNDDAVLALVPAGRRPTLLAQRDAATAGLWNFEIRLQGDNESVFFDI